MKNLTMILSLFLLIIFSSYFLVTSSEKKKPNYIPEDGYVPDSATAAKIAEAIWVPIYGKDRIDKEKPFFVKLVNNEKWYVSGNSNHKNLKGIVGIGCAIIEIRKKDCTILRVAHSK